MSPERRYLDDLRLAHILADRADSVSMERFLSEDLQVESKPDLTPVTDADQAIEEMLRQDLSKSRTRDSVYGEEQGVGGANSAELNSRVSRQWIIDPIDGTKNFVRGVPVWATLIGLVEEDELVMGLVSAPALGMRWWAAKGLGAHTGRSLLRRRQIRVSKIASLSEASLSFSSLAGWVEKGRATQFLDLQASTWRARAYGDFWSYMLVAEGAVDIAAEPELEVYDMAALVAIVQEAGGQFTSLSGEPGPWGRCALATNGLLHQTVLQHLDWENRPTK